MPTAIQFSVVIEVLRWMDVIFSTLAALFGSVPARYSLPLETPSPSASALAFTLVVPKFCNSHAMVKVVALHGCPPPNTMGCCHVELDGKFAGMVLTASLSKE